MKYLFVGCGLSSSIIVYNLINKYGVNPKDITIIDKRNTIGGNCYTEYINDICVHKYGPHIFHTSSKIIWNFLNKFDDIIPYNHNVISVYNDKLYNLPFNMNTFNKLFGVKTPEEAKERIQKEIEELNIKEPTNLEEQALSMVGYTIYNTFIKDYTKKQWGKDPKELPNDIIKRLPIRYTFDNNYYNDIYVGIPYHGYTYIIEKMINGCNLLLNTEFKHEMEKDFDKIFYSGPIDEYYNYCFGKLEYRSVSWENKFINTNNYQGCAVINYNDSIHKFTRSIEHKHFDKNCKNNTSTIISYEYSDNSNCENKSYPINDDKNNELYEKYRQIENNKVEFIGRLGLYKYLDMDKIIELYIDY